ncbi:STAGA complex 65 subunit gamma-like [Asbolus verrucosus]|uniref:STAGA complex 65 subunit gamma-like n=1 Tax=Asbolus verrucosus TaxID=1661398 RepID=A0A482VGZ4_ASBVE|nr:STAGA complex 65 subunit gamma-like [Asbolus verrucosus]
MKRWEKITVEPEIEHNPDVTSDIERSMNNFFLTEFEEDDNHTAKTEKILIPPLNPIMLHAISLHQYANDIVELIKLNELAKKPEKIDLKIPEFDINKIKKSNLNFNSQDFREYVTGSDVKIPELSKTIVRQVLRKSIATICAHIGYETSQQSAIDILSDVLQDFFKKISHHVQITIEDEEKRQMAGFPHVIERVLTEIGMGGVKGLNDYYQSQVIKYIGVLENRCKELNEQYQALSIPKCPSPVDKINKMVRVKVEEEDVVESENPEVHFSTIDGDVNFSILETGYQLLNSLEAEAK